MIFVSHSCNLLIFCQVSILLLITDSVLNKKTINSIITNFCLFMCLYYILTPKASAVTPWNSIEALGVIRKLRHAKNRPPSLSQIFRVKNSFVLIVTKSLTSVPSKNVT